MRKDKYLKAQQYVARTPQQLSDGLRQMNIDPNTVSQSYARDSRQALIGIDRPDEMLDMADLLETLVCALCDDCEGHDEAVQLLSNDTLGQTLLDSARGLVTREQVGAGLENFVKVAKTSK